jgi:hypothetical protein
MNFFSKIKDIYLSLPFPIKVLVGFGFLYIFPPLGIGLIVFAFVLRKKDRNRRNFEYDNYESYKETGKEKRAVNDKKFDEEFKTYEKKLKNEKSDGNDDHVSDMKSAEKILNKTK